MYNRPNASFHSFLITDTILDFLWDAPSPSARFAYAQSYVLV